MSAITLKWKSAASGASVYEIGRATVDDSASATVIATVAGNTYVDETPVDEVLYYYFVRGKNSKGVSAWSVTSGPVQTGTVIGTPTNVEATLNDEGEATVTWTAVDGAASYDVYQHTADDSSSATLVAAGVTGSTHTLGIDSDVPLFFWVRAHDLGAGVSPFSLAAVAFAAPPAPGDLTIDGAGEAGFVYVNWTAADYAQVYDVYRDGVKIGRKLAGEALEWEDSDVLPHEDHDYSVIARNYTGYTESNTVTLQANDPVPVAPTGLTASDGAYPSKVLVEWTGVAYAESYNVYRDGTLLTNVAGTSHEDIVASSTSYTYKVKAVGESGTSLFSNEDTGYAGGLPAPDDVDASDDDLDGVDVTWAAVTGADSYEVYRDGVFLAGPITDLFYHDTPVAGATRSYQVKAVNTVESSGLSSSDNGTRATLEAPAALDASDDVVGHVNVSWAAVTGATAYDLYRNGSLIAGDLTDPEYEDGPGGLAYCTAYSYHAVAKRVVSGLDTNTSGNSPADEGQMRPADEFCDSGGLEADGGEDTYDESFDFCGGSLSVYFNANTIKDRMRVLIDGSDVWDTGCISGEATTTLGVSAGPHTLRIIVLGHCDPGDSGTSGWSFAISCS